jgi:hypothetical protein
MPFPRASDDLLIDIAIVEIMSHSAELRKLLNSQATEARCASASLDHQKPSLEDIAEAVQWCHKTRAWKRLHLQSDDIVVWSSGSALLACDIWRASCLAT